MLIQYMNDKFTVREIKHIYKMASEVKGRVAFCAEICFGNLEDVLSLIVKPGNKNVSTLFNISQNRLIMCASPFSPKFENVLQNCSKVCTDSSSLEQFFKEHQRITVLKIGRKAVLLNKAEEIAVAESMEKNVISKQRKLRLIDSYTSVKVVTPRIFQAEKCYQHTITVVIAPNEKQNFKNPSYPHQAAEVKYPIQATDVDTDCQSMQMAVSAWSIFSRRGETSVPSVVSYQSGNASSSAVNASSSAVNASSSGSACSSTVDASTTQSLSQSRDSVAFIPAVPRYADFMTLEKRLSTYQTTKWQVNEKPDRGILADLGLFFTGRDDLVKCCMCGIGLKDWVKNDDVLQEHVKHSPKCNFLLQRIGKTEVDRIQREIQTAGSSISTGSQLPYKIRSPQYQTMEARLATFKSFPSNTGIPCQELAAAGLYFTGRGDLCRCFTCDGGLKDWSTGDDPCREHATYFSNCDYINQLKGRDYVITLQQRRHNNQPQGAQGDTPQAIQPEASTVLPVDRLGSSSINDSRAVSQVIGLGYTERDIETAKAELRRNGYTNPCVEAVVNTILDMQHQATNTTNSAESDPEDLQAIAEENERFSQMIQCMCVDEEPDILLLPCAHHRICHKYFENITPHCPVCIIL
ncbi:E3 ubiquitin-protein ligase XIAP-like isoform X2 [Mercenaria mercenaria]|uniref:E3 ubiquitin-protein ligase XIAP-like isoform X2 n=1 Tax=Mercenaria mercenaria TaxID=6596 RepID=UPI00234E3C83|nr:E3 ubiquitin-protein ligase XIAP-like isoform X2 [Mercenaria mercenaria]